MSEYVHPHTAKYAEPGMTLREHYAGLYGAAIASSALAAPYKFDLGPAESMADFCAHFAVQYADALIAKLAEKPEEKP